MSAGWTITCSRGFALMMEMDWRVNVCAFGCSAPRSATHTAMYIYDPRRAHHMNARRYSKHISYAYIADANFRAAH